jgi:hypothetical protein
MIERLFILLKESFKSMFIKKTVFSILKTPRNNAKLQRILNSRGKNLT